MSAKKSHTVPTGIDPELVRKLSDDIKNILAQVPIPGTCTARLPFSRLSYCGRKVVSGSELCYWHLPDTTKYSARALVEYFGETITVAQALEREVKAGASLENFFLEDCRLGGDFLKNGPNLQGARFIFANLRRASMSESNLSSAVFVGADLTRAKLSSCVLSGATFLNARLFETKFRDNDLKSVKDLQRSSFRGKSRFGFSVDRILEEYPEQAAPMYRELTSYFAARGMLDDASWAAYRASVLQHRLLRKDVGFAAIQARQTLGLISPTIIPVQGSFLIEYLSGISRWAKSGVFLLLTGYGERPLRVIVAAMMSILVYAGLYSVPGAITGHGFYDALYFSIITFTTLGYGDMLPKGGFRLVAGSEALCGILFTGLFLFCIGRKTVSRG